MVVLIDAIAPVIPIVLAIDASFAYNWPYRLPTIQLEYIFQKIAL